jgi:hypothetical protein
MTVFTSTLRTSMLCLCALLMAGAVPAQTMASQESSAPEPSQALAEDAVAGACAGAATWSTFGTGESVTADQCVEAILLAMRSGLGHHAVPAVPVWRLIRLKRVSSGSHSINVGLSNNSFAFAIGEVLI